MRHDSLNESLVDYLRIRRQVGFELERAGRELTGFVAFLEQSGAERITSELALRWACQPGASERYHSLRLGMVRGFAQYLATLDPESEIPPSDLLSARLRRITPYLYSEREIAELTAAAGALTPPLRGATYRTIIGLLAVTAIRIGEALALDRDDVSLDGGMLRLRVAKQHKQRLVPLHETTTSALREYARERDRTCPRPATAAFFLNANRTRICGSVSVFDRTFRTLIRQVEPRPGAEQAHRRANDLRHTFAVQTLVRWHQAGVDVDRAMPLLSTYLGHYVGDPVKGPVGLVVCERGAEEAVGPFLGEWSCLGELDRDGWVADGERGEHLGHESGRARRRSRDRGPLLQPARTTRQARPARPRRSRRPGRDPARALAC